MKVKRIILHFSIYMVFQTLFYFNLFAQTETMKQNETESDSPVIEAIEAFDVAKNSEQLEGMLQIYDKAGTLQDDIRAIQAKYPAFSDELEKMIKDPGMQNPGHFNERDFIDGINIWNGYKSTLDGWQSKLENRTKELEKIVLSLASIEKRWNLTRKTGLNTSYPQPVRIRIYENVQSIKNLSAVIQSRIKELLDLQNEISIQSIKVVKIINAFEEAGDSYQLSLFKRDAAPIWDIFSGPVQTQSLIDDLKTTISRQKQFVHYYYTVHEFIYVIQIILFIIIFSSIVVIKKTKKNLSSEDMFSIFLQRYFSSTILSVFFIMSMSFPNPPLLITAVNTFILVFPMIRILKPIADEKFKSSLYLFALLILMFEIKLILPPNSLAERIMFISIVSLILYSIVFVIKPILKKRSSESVWYGRLNKMSSFSAYLLIISTVFNLYGNTSLANLLVDGFTKSIFASLIMYLAISFLQGLLNIGISYPGVANLSIIRRKGDLINQRGIYYIKIVGVITLFIFILKYFQLRDISKDMLYSILEFEMKAGAMSVSIGNIISFFIALWVTILVSRFIRFILEADVYPRVRLPRGVPGSISLLAHYSILAIGFLFALSAAGIEWSKFALIAGALGVGVGFGLQDIVNNFISGLVLIFERPIKLGDVIEIDSLRGAVKRIGIRSSTIRTFDGSEVIVPNGQLISNSVVNWTLSDKQRRVIIELGVAYGTDPGQVIKILNEIADDNEEVLEKPEPLALFTEFGDSSLNFEIRFWTNNFDEWLRLKHDLTLEIHNRLKKANIEIPFPQRDLNIRTIDDRVVEKVKRNSEHKVINSPKTKNARK